MLQHDANLIQETTPGVGEKNPAAVSFEQLNTQFGLQIAYVAAYRRLRNPQPFSCFGEAELFCHRDERMELPKIHLSSFRHRFTYTNSV
jgi:hypothetical protein